MQPSKNRVMGGREEKNDSTRRRQSPDIREDNPKDENLMGKLAKYPKRNRVVNTTKDWAINQPRGVSWTKMDVAVLIIPSCISIEATKAQNLSEAVSAVYPAIRVELPSSTIAEKTNPRIPVSRVGIGQRITLLAQAEMSHRSTEPAGFPDYAGIASCPVYVKDAG